jgi:lipopolysaccharide transport system permease protein
MKNFSISPIHILSSVWCNWSLTITLIKREVTGRYRGSILGILWSFLNPLFMLAVYTFFFSVVFKARWAGGSESKTEFALVLFAGLIVFNLFAECVNRAPSLVLSNVNFVKKVVFPLEVLPWVVLGSALLHMIISLGVWLLFYIVFFGIPHVSIFYLPIVILPLLILTLGISWFLSSLGVYLRDLSQVIGTVTTVLMFMSPVFYPVANLPEKYRMFVLISPLTLSVEQARDVMIFGKPINWTAWLPYLFVSMTIAWLGFAWFQKTRKGFADVV